MGPRNWLFGFNCWLAGMLALYISFQFELPNPYWALITVYLTSQPMLGGGVLAKALYRIAGTLLGLAAALLIIPNLVDAPELMMLALAAWQAVCLYLALLDRTPRGYVLMLAGYTAILVGLPIIDDPIRIFDQAVARAEEILIGALSAGVVQALVFPASVETILGARLGAVLADGRRWITSALGAQGTAPGPEEHQARRKLAADVTELSILATNLRFEPTRQSAAPALERALEDRLTILLPLMAGIEDRISAIRALGAYSADLEALVGRVSDWVAAGSMEGTELLLAECTAATPEVTPDSPWPDLVRLSLAQRLAKMIEEWRDSLELSELLRNPKLRPRPRLLQLAASPGPRALHYDRGLAALSGLTAGMAVMVVALSAMAVQWPPATTAIGLGAVFCSIFATADDPRPMQIVFLTWTLISLPVGMLYVYVLLPAIEGFVPLALVMLPLLTLLGAYLSAPKYSLRALSAAIVVINLMTLQPSYQGDFITFATAVLAVLLGGLAALVTTSLMRVISAEVAAWRILRAGWRDLARLALSRRPANARQFAARMHDRLGLLLPRLAQAATRNPELRLADALRDLHFGYNLSQLIEACAALPPAGRRSLEELRRALSGWFSSMARGHIVPPPEQARERLDEVLAALLQQQPGPARLLGITVGVGLSRNLAAAASPAQAGAL
jgi:uncharacterized membrane protein YccC